MKKKIKQQQKFKYRHLLLGQKGKKRLVKKNSSKFILVSRTACTVNFTAKHIEIIRRIFYKPVTDFLGGFILSRIYPYIPITKKPLQTRMGKGKGKVQKYVVPINKGTHLLNIFGTITDIQIKKLYKKIAYKISSQIRLKKSTTI